MTKFQMRIAHFRRTAEHDINVMTVDMKTELQAVLGIHSPHARQKYRILAIDFEKKTCYTTVALNNEIYQDQIKYHIDLLKDKVEKINNEHRRKELK